jgi:predicted 3-demethylubiquinone-9 3-methyltransferase (glyoxalase superfamily)
MSFIKATIATAFVMVGVASMADESQVRQPAKSSEPTRLPAKQDTTRAGESGRVSDIPGLKQEASALPKVTPFLMFYGKADEAMTLYTSVFPNSKVTSIKRYGKGEAAAEGWVVHATFTLNGQGLMCIDSPAKHDFTFTPATSLFVDCASEAEIDEIFAKLSKNGKVYMPLEGYPFAKKFVWFTDKFGVSWQLSWQRH